MNSISKCEMIREDLLSDAVTVVVSSCDLYEDAWMPFFKLFQKHWPNCPFSKILITEEKVYECDFMDIKTIKTGKGKSWTKRIEYALEQVKSEYVLFFLEDFFITNEVNVLQFENAINFLQNNRKAGVIYYHAASKQKKYNDEVGSKSCFLKVKKTEPYRTKVVASLWRKEYFEKLLYGEEDPWEYERESSYRSACAGYDVYREDYDISVPTFLYYINPKDKMGITKGKWLSGNKPYFESEGIFGIDFERIGVLEEDITYRKIKEEHVQNSKVSRKEYVSSLSRKDKIREYLYDVKHAIFKKLRIDKFKKYIFYWNYYRKSK